ncbi:MAG: hypothetical protein JF592_04465 [Microbacterium sp.]|uniref:hypothetical protein n=1 Tax=Microbacterium sp. TaxID=51671 RepID=UPI001D5A6C4D|nr:hypothetical protein [Microbacterium sp.]MBW8761825.1 hypothetical protein [Microbacterium sp.]
MASKKRTRLLIQTWVPVLSGLVGVAVGGLFAYGAVERQIQVGQEAEQRQIRAEAYLALTEAAADYANSTRAVLNEQQIRGDVAPTAIDALSSSATVGDWLSSRHSFQNALNQVYIYGSDEGWTAAAQLAETLPHARGEEYEWVELSPRFTARYNGVLTIICKEATISPRADCSTE